MELVLRKQFASIHENSTVLKYIKLIKVEWGKAKDIVVFTRLGGTYEE
jgi:hypothetical protein